MSLLETGSRNIGREYTYSDIGTLRGLVYASGLQPNNTDLAIGATLAMLRILDVAHGRVPSSEDARLYAIELLRMPLSYLPG